LGVGRYRVKQAFTSAFHGHGKWFAEAGLSVEIDLAQAVVGNTGHW
jgi:hypothetical protein